MIRLFRPFTRSYLSISLSDVGLANLTFDGRGDAQKIIHETCLRKYGGWRVLSVTIGSKSVVFENVET